MDNQGNSFQRHSNMANGTYRFAWVSRIAVILAVVNFSYYFLSCVFYIVDAYDDYQKFTGLGFAHPYAYYLEKVPLLHTLCMALVVIGELFLFCILVQKRKNTKNIRRGLYCFAVILVIHVIAWIMACNIKIPDSPPFIAENGLGRQHYIFALETLAQALLYFLSAIIKRH